MHKPTIINFQIKSTKCTAVTAASCSPLLVEGYSTPPAPPQQSAGGLQVDFESVFGAKASGSNSLSSDGEHFFFAKDVRLTHFFLSFLELNP